MYSFEEQEHSFEEQKQLFEEQEQLSIDTDSGIGKARKQVRSTFLFTVIAGTILIFMFLYMSETKYSVLYMLIPMLFYIIYGHQLANRHKYMPEFADSVYFLGFSFTLLSLLGATVFEKLEGDPEKTISYFGMALSTTILGLLYRNWHMQFTEVGDDPLEKAKKHLEREVTNFVLISKGLKESMGAVTEGFERLSDFPDDVKSVIDDFDEQVESSFGKIKSNYEHLGEMSESMISQADASMSKISEEFSLLDKRFETAVRSTASEAEKMQKTISELNTTLGDGLTKEGLITHTKTSLITATNQLTNLSNQIKSLASSFEQNLDSVDALFKQVEKLLLKKFQ